MSQLEIGQAFLSVIALTTFLTGVIFAHAKRRRQRRESPKHPTPLP